jgi:hypothetical protein
MESSGEGVSSDSWQPIGYIKEDNYSDYHHCRGDHYICSLPFLKRSLVLVRHRRALPHCSSAYRLTAGASGFLNLSQSGDLPDR